MRFKTIFTCQKCGFNSTKWLGQCPDCGAWNSLTEEVIAEESKKSKSAKSFTEFSSPITPLKEASLKDYERIQTGIAEFDRLLGGGLVKGQLVLLAGAPGIGKSTLMMQTAAKLAKNQKVLYVSGEESVEQIALRARRLGCASDNIFLVSQTNVQQILEAVKEVKPQVLIVDSVQTIYHPEFSSTSGSLSQVRESAGEILRLTKPLGIITFLLGHITKEGSLAGPKVLEHMVDSVLYFETEKDNVLRILRAHKNRFGSTSEIALFKMTQTGLEDVPDASLYFASTSRSKDIAGRALSIALEGSRPILSEVQALVSPTHYPFPRRITTGLDLNRTQILLAALERHVGLNLDTKDVCVSLGGGIKINDTGLDMALCAAVISSLRDKPLSASSVFIGEMGILGQSAAVAHMDTRIAEARRLGFKQIYTPPIKDKSIKKDKDIIEVEDLFYLSGKI